MDSFRFIHTADWHLGREFHGADLTGAHREFLEWLANLAEAERVDAVLMAGDIYDRALPPVSAVEVFREGVARLSEVAPLVLITGNHDSVIRMSLGELMRSEITLRAGTGKLGQPVNFNPFGDGKPGVAVYPVPFLEPGLHAPELDPATSGQEGLITAALERCRADLASCPTGTRSIAIAHAFVTGGAVSESERRLAIGGAEMVPSDTFHGFDYVALGHLHRPQELGARIAYSGSPIPYSFSEVAPPGETETAPKSVRLIELSATGQISADTVPIPAHRRISRLEGELEALLEDPELDSFAGDWLEVTLTDASRAHAPMERLRRRFSHVLSLRFAHDPASARTDSESLQQRLVERDPLELAADFVEQVRGEAPDSEELELLREALGERLAAEARR